MKTVLLRGELGKKFGRVHRFDLNTPAEAIRALKANFEGFESELVAAGERGIGYMVQIGKDAMKSLDEIAYPTGTAEAISFTPVLQGAGGDGLGAVFAGVGLIAAALLLGPIGIAAVGGQAALAVGSIGAALALGGTSQLLSPTISDNSAAGPVRQRSRESFAAVNNEIADNRSSYIFNGAVNLTAQGTPVPLCYGRVKVGSVVISAGLSVEDI